MDINKFKIYPMLAFSDFFSGQSFDIKESLKCFRKEELMDAITVLSFNYKNSFIPDEESTFFSEASNCHVGELNDCWDAYAKGKPVDFKACFISYRTTLQLIRYIYSIPYEQFRGDIDKKDFEYVLFKILLAINEELYDDRSDTTDKGEMIFYLQYAMNDLNQTSIPNVLRIQSYYCSKLFEFLESDSRNNELYFLFLNYFGIQNWREYISTIFCLIFYIENISRQNPKTNIRIQVSKLPPLVRQKISLNVLDKISIPIDEYIAFEASDHKDRNNNVDYRRFRSCPFIKTSADCYHPISYQMICELLYNSTYFVLSHLYGHNFSSFYNKRFVEEYLFHRTIIDMYGE